MKSSKHILITGGAGFIGSNLCAHFLKLGHKVRCIDNLSTGKIENIAALLSEAQFEFIEEDIRDFESCQKAVKGVDAVLHQAALGSVPRSIDDPITTNAVNITGFLNMLEASRKEGVERFVYAASSSTYGDHQELPKVEERIGKPLSPYAVTKYANELYAKVYHDLFGMKIIGLRYFNVFGRNQDPNGAYAAAIPKFIRAFMDYHSPVIHGDGEQTRDFTYIDNVVSINELAINTENSKAYGEVFNVAYGEQSSVNAIVKKIQELLSNYDKKVLSVSLDYAAPRLGDVRHSLASVEKARTLLGYAPQHSVLKGLEEAIDWYWHHLKEK